ncbi:MAG: hypothetical protein GX605_02275 [Chloroflexi bacterium]|nr:hypothetical protein [Chloroflexota bacterium]
MRAILALAVGAHGLGHIFFLAPTLGLSGWGVFGRSWLLSGRVPAVAVQTKGGAPWLLALLGFVAAEVGVWGQHGWRRDLAIASAALSLRGLALFAQPLQPFISAGLMNVAILVALLWLRWPPTGQF